MMTLRFWLLSIEKEGRAEAALEGTTERSVML